MSVHKPYRLWSVLCAFGMCLGMSTLAIAGTVSGTITIVGLKAGTKFTITVYGDDGKEVTLINPDQSGSYSIALPPGRYKVRCTLPGSNAVENATVYLFALDGPITRNMSLNCG